MASKQNNASGVFLGESYVEWAILARKKNRLETANRAQGSLDVNEETDRSSSEFASQFKTACGKLKKPVTLAIPSDQALLRVVDLPPVDADELADMVELQVDKFSPFPVENMIVSHEILVQDEEHMRVLVAAVREDAVMKMGELFRKAGLPLTRVDVDSLAWWHHIVNNNDVLDEGRQITLLHDMGGTELIFSQDGVPLIFRSLGNHYDMEPEQMAADLAEEVTYTLTSLESEWGTGATHLLKLYHWGDEPPGLAQALREACEMDVQTRPFEDLPTISEGVAQRTPLDNESRIDLTPETWHTTESMKRLQRKLIRATAAIFVFWLIGLGSVMFLHKTAMAKVTALQTEVDELEVEASEVRRISGRINELKNYGGAKSSAIEYLRESSVYLPEGIDLSNFTYKKYRSILIKGTATSSAPVFEFVEALENSPLFIKPDPDIKTKFIRGKRVTEFTITATMPEPTI